MDRRREDVRDSFLDMVNAENETAIQAFETPLEVSVASWRQNQAFIFSRARALPTGLFLRGHVKEGYGELSAPLAPARPLPNCLFIGAWQNVPSRKMSNNKMNAPADTFFIRCSTSPPPHPPIHVKMLDRALEEGDEVAEKKARRAILRQAARERVHVREKAARVLADQRRLGQQNRAGYVHVVGK